MQSAWLGASQVASGTLQSVPFVFSWYSGGKGNPPRGVLEVQGAQGPEFSLAREADDMRKFLRLGSGNPLQTGNAGMDPALDSDLVAGAEREAARALFHLGFDQLQRRSGTLRAVKIFCSHLPELEVLQRALTYVAVLRPGTQ